MVRELFIESGHFSLSAFKSLLRDLIALRKISVRSEYK